MTEFKLDVLIAEYNRQRSKSIKTSRTWGFVYLTPEGLDVLNGISEELTAIRQKQTYRISLPTLRNRYESMHTLKQSRSSKDLFASAKKIIREEMSLTIRNKIQPWELEQANWLSNENSWQTLYATNPEAKGSLWKLKKFWDRQKHFACASNEYLLKSSDWLTELEEQLQLAEAEMLARRKRLPKFIAEQYANFLASLRKELNSVRQDVLNTMYCRLYVAADSYSVTGNFHQDDVVVYCIKELQRFGAVKKTMSFFGWWTTLQPEHFNRFHELIQRDGKKELRQDLSQLPWFTRSDGQIKITNVVIDKYTYVCPVELAPFVPKGDRKPKWFFQLFQSRRSVEFIQQNQSVFATLQLGYPKITPLEVSERFARLDSYESLIHQEAVKSRAVKFSPWQLWSYFGYRQLIGEWQVLLQKREEFCIAERIRLLEQIATVELPPADKDQKYQLWLLVREQINKFSVMKPGLARLILKRIDAVEIALKTNLEQEPQAFANCLLRSLAGSQIINDDETEYLLKIIESNDLSYDRSWIDEIKPHFSKALVNLLQQTKGYCQQQTTSVSSPVIINNLLLAQRLGENDQQHLQRTLRQIVYSQSHGLTQEGYEQASIRLLSLQKLIYQFGDESLKTWMSGLPININQDEWPRFLTHWHSKLKSLFPQSSDLIDKSNKVEKQAKEHGITSLLSNWFFPRIIASEEQMSQSLPALTPVVSARQLFCQ